MQSRKLRSDQMRRIRAGFEHDLSMEQVSVYAKPEFTWDQMEQVFFGFIDRLSMEQVAVYAKPEFTREQMKQIREGFEQGLSMEEVSALIKKPSLAKKIMAAKKSRGRLRAKNRKRARVMRSWRNKNRIKGEIMNVLFFTGAGISKDSGVPTFQEIDGIRTKLRRKYAALHPAEIRDMMREFKGFMKDKEPNAAHVAIAKAGFPVITMNVDELHQGQEVRMFWRFTGIFLLKKSWENGIILICLWESRFYMEILHRDIIKRLRNCVLYEKVIIW